eukprot:GEMP01071585.1.p1 GENE.GEMP01071585.1~~GEMP01071585.1.p1  ORF type:complete len:237 (+),score=62.24 GEMP01071585.1:79-789(+)
MRRFFSNMLRTLAIGAAICTLTFMLATMSISYSLLQSPVSIKLELLPYGNSMAWNKCQHGPIECQHNMVEACILKHIPDPKAHLSVICCYEEQLLVGHADPIDALKKCTSLLSFTYTQDEIIKCYGNFAGAEGIAAVEDVAKRTPKDHQYVPWVNVNGVHDPLAERNLHERLCQLPPLNGTPECKNVNVTLANFPVAAPACWKDKKALESGLQLAVPHPAEKLAKDMEDSTVAIVA